MTSEMQTMTCPRCGVEETDYDGLGMLAHTKPTFEKGCGWCSHPSKDQEKDGPWVCGLCGSKFLWNVTYVNKIGLRTMLGPKQGRCMKNSRQEAEEYLAAVMKNSGEQRLVDVCGEQARGTFRVDEFECYPHGDPKSSYVD